MHCQRKLFTGRIFLRTSVGRPRFGRPLCPCAGPFASRYRSPLFVCANVCANINLSLAPLAAHAMLKAKRRIYGLKDEGRQLDSATVELEGRLEDCRAKLDRIVQVCVCVYVSCPSARHSSLVVASTFAWFSARTCRVSWGEGTGRGGGEPLGRVWSIPSFCLECCVRKYGAVAFVLTCA